MSFQDEINAGKIVICVPDDTKIGVIGSGHLIT